MRYRRTEAFTLVEMALAVLIMVGLAYGTYSSSHAVTRAFSKSDLTLDRVTEVATGAEKLAQEIREARDLLYPPPGSTVSSFLVLRNFEGDVVTWRFAGTDLTRTVAGLAGPAPDARPAARRLDGVRFGQPAPGLITFGLFAGEASVLSAAARRTR
jgi:hypothetical protein